MGVEICEGLEKAHRSGVIHRDLKPGNIMLTKSGGEADGLWTGQGNDVAVVGRFGQTAVPAGNRSGERHARRHFPVHVAEQLQGHEADARRDIFALGAVLYEDHREKGVPGQDQISVASAILGKDPELITASQPLAPPEDKSSGHRSWKIYQSPKDLNYFGCWQGRLGAVSQNADFARWFVLRLTIGKVLINS